MRRDRGPISVVGEVRFVCLLANFYAVYSYASGTGDRVGRIVARMRGAIARTVARVMRGSVGPRSVELSGRLLCSGRALGSACPCGSAAHRFR